MSETPAYLAMSEIEKSVYGATYDLRSWMKRVEVRLDHLEGQQAQTETQPSSPAIESTADGPNGNDTWSRTWHFVRADPHGGSRIIATVTFQDFSSLPTRGVVRKLLQDEALILATPDQWASLRLSGATPSTIPEAGEVGRPAGGEAKFLEGAMTCCCKVYHRHDFGQALYIWEPGRVKPGLNCEHCPTHGIVRETGADHDR